MAAPRIPVNVRLTQETIDRIDVIADNRRTDEFEATRTDIIREALADYFAKVTRTCREHYAGPPTQLTERCLRCGVSLSHVKTVLR